MLVVNKWTRSLGVIGLILGGLVSADWSSAQAASENEQTSLTAQESHPLSWDKKLPATSRFTVLSDFAGAAVRDNETGLVWEQSTETKTMTWQRGRFYCANVQAAHYWSASSFAGKPTHAWNVGFIMGMVHDIKMTENHNVWCVRGENNANAY